MSPERTALHKILQVVNKQAQDDGLWFAAVTAPEAYLQQELRRLSAVIEREARVLDPLPQPDGSK